MPRYSFFYEEIVLNDGRKVLRPMLTVEIMNEGRVIPCRAIVDSGADYCSFPADFLPDLGLDKRDLPFGKGRGIGGETDFYFKELQLRIEKIGTLLVEVGFTDTQNGWNAGLLGQAGFFDSFRVVFDKHAKTFSVEG